MILQTVFLGRDRQKKTRNFSANSVSRLRLSKNNERRRILQTVFLGRDRQKTNKCGLILEMAILGRDCHKINKRRMILEMANPGAIINNLSSAD